MSLLHLRVVGPQEHVPAVLDALAGTPGIVAVTHTSLGDTAPGLAEVRADLARECADDVLSRLHRLGVTERGMILLDAVDTAIGTLAGAAERDAPGEAADALIWDELVTRTGEDATLTWMFVAFMVLATLLAAIGVVTDSPITIVGAMVVGPEFGPLAALAVSLVRRRGGAARRAGAALIVCFPAAIVVTSLLALLGRATGLIHANLLEGHRQTEFIYHPGWFSLITALVAGTAGMLSLTSNRSAALVGVFISVTTIPAAGNAAVAAVLTDWYEAGQSLLQLGVNVVGIVTAATVTLALRGAAEARTRARGA
jgi:uncharacterized hydrophobic protein (TIGR00271 family)